MKKEFTFTYDTHESLDTLPTEELKLVTQARKALTKSYSPFSCYKVGAAARLESGRILTASNQESEVFPSGLCAERTLLFAHMASEPEDRVVALAIVSDPSERECYPCGACRQVMADVQSRQKSPFKVIMCSAASATVVDDVSDLLPLSFKL